MCCGQNRTSVKPAIAPPIPKPVEPARSSVTVQSQVPPPGQSRSPALLHAGPVAYFEYRGNTSLIAIGSATGTRYHFSGPGKRVAVDVRDRPSLAMVPMLAEVRNS